MSGSGASAEVGGPGATTAGKPSPFAAESRLIARSCEVTPGPPERLLSLGLVGEAGYWDARALGDPLAWGHVGVAWSRSLSAEGTSDGVAEASRAARCVLERLDVPALRAVVAVPFDGVGGFVRVPRVAYSVEGSVGRVTVIGDPLDDDLDARLESVRTQWARAAAGPPVERELPSARLLDDGRDAYARLVSAAVDAIFGGRFEKIVTARKIELALRAMPALDALVAALPTSRVARFLIAHAGETFFGATPETLVRLAGGTATADALAGSRPAPASDAGARSALTEELLASDKDRREHAHVVAFVRRALASLGELSPVASPRVVELPNVWHLHTPVTAEVRSGVSVDDLVAALHPTPAVLGVPAGPARAWLRDHETFSRGLYAGSLGTLDARGEGTFVVGIRSGKLFVDPDTHEARATLYAGGGIVAGSEIDKELDETTAKLAPLRRVLGCEGGPP